MEVSICLELIGSLAAAAAAAAVAAGAATTGGKHKPKPIELLI